MERLDNERLSSLRARLENRHAQLRGEVHATLQQLGENRLAAEVHDTKDQAFTGLLTQIRHADMARDLEEAGDIEAALERMRSGTYGTCMSCGESIPFSRLSAYPTAKRCLPCQQEYERYR